MKHIDFFLSAFLSPTKILYTENFMQSSTILKKKIIHFSIDPTHRCS